jgi:hypothetical protein
VIRARKLASFRASERAKIAGRCRLEARTRGNGWMDTRRIEICPCSKNCKYRKGKDDEQGTEKETKLDRQELTSKSQSDIGEQ